MFSDTFQLDGRSRSKGLFKERVSDAFALPNPKSGKATFTSLWQTPDKPSTSIINELLQPRKLHQMLSSGVRSGR